MSPNSRNPPSGSKVKSAGFRFALVAALILLGVLCLRIARDFLSDDLPALELPEPVRPVAAVPTPSAVPPPRPAVPRVAPAAAATNVPAAAAPATNAVPVPVAAPVRKPADDVPAARQVRLANRTRKLPNHARPFPRKFAESQTPSARGTVPYVVVSEFPVSDLVREEAVKLGVRVLGYMPVNALLVEADAAGLKRLEEQDVFFAGAFELEPVDKVQRLKTIIKADQAVVHGKFGLESYGDDLTRIIDPTRQTEKLVDADRIAETYLYKCKAWLERGKQAHDTAEQLLRYGYEEEALHVIGYGEALIEEGVRQNVKQFNRILIPRIEAAAKKGASLDYTQLMAKIRILEGLGNPPPPGVPSVTLEQARAALDSRFGATLESVVEECAEAVKDVNALL